MGAGANIGSRAVAIAYVMQKVPYVFPIVGGRKVEHLHANLEALDIALTEAHIRKIESAVPFEAGAPHNLTVSLLHILSGEHTLMRAVAMALLPGRRNVL